MSEKQEILHFESLNAHLSLNCPHIHGYPPHSDTCHNSASARGDNLARKHPRSRAPQLKFVNELGVPFFDKSSHQTRLVTWSERRVFIGCCTQYLNLLHATLNKIGFVLNCCELHATNLHTALYVLKAATCCTIFDATFDATCCTTCCIECCAV